VLGRADTAAHSPNRPMAMAKDIQLGHLILIISLEMQDIKLQ